MNSQINYSSYTNQDVYYIVQNYNKEVSYLREKVSMLEAKVKILEEKKPSMKDFTNLFVENVKNLAKLLYDQQYVHKHSPITDPDVFQKWLYDNDPSLFEFYQMLYESINNPKGKRNLETKRKMKIKVMILCHILANYRNCKITNVTGAIGSYIYRSGLNINAINLLSNILCFPRYETVLYKSKNIVKDHSENINRYIANNKENAIILNLDDYHDCHETKVPNQTSISQICHMASTLINIPKMKAIPNSNRIYQCGLINSNKLNSELRHQINFYTMI